MKTPSGPEIAVEILHDAPPARPTVSTPAFDAMSVAA
jgi:hypothetical protein